VEWWPGAREIALAAGENMSPAFIAKLRKSGGEKIQNS